MIIVKMVMIISVDNIDDRDDNDDSCCNDDRDDNNIDAYIYSVLPPPPPTPITFIIHGDAPSILLGDGDDDAVMCSMSSIWNIYVNNHIDGDDRDDVNDNGMTVIIKYSILYYSR